MAKRRKRHVDGGNGKLLIGIVGPPPSTAESIQRDLQEPWSYFLRAASQQPRATKAVMVSTLAYKTTAAELTKLLGVAEKRVLGLDVEFAQRKKRSETQRDRDEALALVQSVGQVAKTQGVTATLRNVGGDGAPGGPAIDDEVRKKLARLKDLGQVLAIAWAEGSPPQATAASRRKRHKPQEDLNNGDPDRSYDSPLEDVLDEERREMARFTPEEREQRELVASLVASDPERFANAGKRLETNALRYIRVHDAESLLSSLGPMLLIHCADDYCKLDFDLLPRQQRLSLAEEVMLLHWIATDPDAGDVQPSPTVISNVPWGEGNPPHRSALRDLIFAPQVEESGGVTELVPSHIRDRWFQVVQISLRECGSAYSRAADNQGSPIAGLDFMSLIANAADDRAAWLSNKATATKLGISTSTLRNYRHAGRRADNGLAGVDKNGRVWRKAGKNAHPEYLRSSLRKSRET